MHRASRITIVAALALLAFFLVRPTAGQPQAPADMPASPTAPSTAPTGKVAVLDVVRVFNECAQIADLNEEIRQKTDDFSKEAAQRKRVIEDKQTELGAFRPGTSDYDLRRKDLVRLNIEANVWLKVREQEIEQQKFDWTRVIYDKAAQAAGGIARERNFEVVIQRTLFKSDEIEQNLASLRRLIQERAVLWHVPEIDITDLVIRRLDTEYRAAGGKKSLSSTTQPTRN